MSDIFEKNKDLIEEFKDAGAYLDLPDGEYTVHIDEISLKEEWGFYSVGLKILLPKKFEGQFIFDSLRMPGLYQDKNRNKDKERKTHGFAINRLLEYAKVTTGEERPQLERVQDLPKNRVFKVEIKTKNTNEGKSYTNITKIIGASKNNQQTNSIPHNQQTNSIQLPTQTETARPVPIPGSNYNDFDGDEIPF